MLNANAHSSSGNPHCKLFQFFLNVQNPFDKFKFKKGLFKHIYTAIIFQLVSHYDAWSIPDSDIAQTNVDPASWWRYPRENAHVWHSWHPHHILKMSLVWCLWPSLHRHMNCKFIAVLFCKSILLRWKWCRHSAELAHLSVVLIEIKHTFIFNIFGLWVKWRYFCCYIQQSHY